MAAERVVFAGQSGVNALVAQVGIEKGFFEDQGIEIEHQMSRSGRASIDAVASGHADFGVATSPPLLAAIDRDLPLVIVALLSHGYSGKLIASNEYNELQHLEDFKGKTIGVQVGTGVHTVFQMAIDRIGLADSDFDIRNVRVQDMPAAMQGGEFDAVLGWEPGMRRIVEVGYGTEVVSVEDFERLADVTAPFVLFTTRRSVAERPEMVQQFIVAWAESQRYAWAEREDSIRHLRALLGDAFSHFDDKQLTELTYIYKYDRTVLSEADIDDIRNTGDFLFTRGRIATRPDLDTVNNNAFAERAEQLLR